MSKAQEKEAKTYKPSDLAEELDVDGKSIRAFLRREFTRPSDQKNTSWTLTEEMAQAVRDHFEDSDEEDEEETESDEDEA